MRISDWSSDVCSSDLSVFGPLEYHKPGSGYGTGAGFLRAFGVEPPESGSRFRKRPPHLFAADLRARHGQILKNRQRRHLQSPSSRTKTRSAKCLVSPYDLTL